MTDKTITADDITTDTKISINYVSRDDVSSVNIVETVDGKRRYTRIGSIYSKTKNEYTCKNSRLVSDETEKDPAVQRVKLELSYIYTEVLFKEYKFFATRGLPASIIDKLSDTERAKISCEITRLNRQHESILASLLSTGFEVRQKLSDSKICINAASLKTRIKELMIISHF
jgi:hypothetical protein